MRVYLTGSLCLEAGEQLLAESALPGPQGRHLLGFLAAEHARPLSRDELASEIWPASMPAAWESSLKAIVSKVRAALSRAGLPGAELIRNAFGAYQFRLPRQGWVDVDAVVLAVHLAEAALKGGDLDGAAGHAFVARLITARPFLPGVEGIWRTNGAGNCTSSGSVPSSAWQLSSFSAARPRPPSRARNSCSGSTNCARAAGGS
jgi:DNA-binding SARP family transcriptional activator